MPDKPTDRVYKRDYVLMRDPNGGVIEVDVDEGMLSITQAMLRGCVQTAPAADAEPTV